MVALPNLNVSSSPSTWGGGLTGGGAVQTSMAGAPPVSQAGGGGGVLGSMSGLGSYNPFPSGAPQFGAGGGASGGSAPAGGWNASNLPGGGLAPTAPPTYVPPPKPAAPASSQTPGQAAVANAVANSGALNQVNLPTGATPALPQKAGDAMPTQPAGTSLETIQNTRGGPVTQAYVPTGTSSLSAIGAVAQPPAGAIAWTPGSTAPAGYTYAALPGTAGKQYYVPTGEPINPQALAPGGASSGFGGQQQNPGYGGLATLGMGSIYATNPNVRATSGRGN